MATHLFALFVLHCNKENKRFANPARWKNGGTGELSGCVLLRILVWKFSVTAARSNLNRTVMQMSQSDA